MHWRLLLGGPLIWAAHFGLIYAAASIFHVVRGEPDAAARIVTLVITALCFGGSGFVLAAALRQPRAEPLDRFWRIVAATGAILAMIAIFWQTLPALIPIEGTAPQGLSSPGL